MSLPSNSPDSAVDSLFARLMSATTAQRLAATHEVFFVIAALKIQHGEHVLDFPCGTGRHAYLLAQYGCNVHAADSDPSSIFIAKNEFAHPNIHYFCCDVRDQIPSRNDNQVLISIYSFIGYLPNEDLNDHIFQKLMSLIPSGGRFLISTANRIFVSKQKSRLFEFNDDGYFIRRLDKYDSKTCTIRHEWEVTEVLTGLKFSRTQCRRLYSKEEIFERFDANGAKKLCIYGNFNADVFDDKGSSQLVVLGEKK